MRYDLTDGDTDPHMEWCEACQSGAQWRCPERSIPIFEHVITNSPTVPITPTPRRAKRRCEYCHQRMNRTGECTRSDCEGNQNAEPC